MPTRRRDFLTQAVLAGAASAISYRPVAAQTAAKTGIPGAYPGKVVSVEHPGALLSGQYQREAVRGMITRGLTELTGAGSLGEALKAFVEPGDVVGVKLNPVGAPYVISSAEVVQELMKGLNDAGIPNKDIVAYDRYRDQFIKAGFVQWLPEGVRWSAAAEKYDELQWGMDGYDPDVYMQMALVRPEGDPRNPHHRRSYAAKYLTKEVNKLINLCLLKHHQSAGVTLALKNLSHGLVNNVSRSHATSTLNACNAFIPAVVDMPVIREKVVLNILDGVKGAYHGGPGSKVKDYVWAHNTMYFSTDPVAMDKTGWQVIDAKRREMGMEPVIAAEPDKDSTFASMQPEHVEIAGALGLGEYQDEKIVRRKIKLT